MPVSLMLLHFEFVCCHSSYHFFIISNRGSLAMSELSKSTYPNGPSFLFEI